MVKRGISIIMPSYNSGKFIRKAIESVVNQTFENWELIVIDDCSNDNTPTITQEFSKIHSRIKIIRNEINLGVAASRNAGLGSAMFDYISFLDADDVWDKKKLELQYIFMVANQVPICFTKYFKINSCDEIIGSVNEIPKLITYTELLKGNCIAMSTAMIDLKLVKKVLFKSVGHEDYLFWLNMLQHGVYARGLNEKLLYYRVHSSSLSSNKLKAITYTWRIYREHLKFSFFRSLYYFVCHEFAAIKKMLRSYKYSNFR